MQQSLLNLDAVAADDGLHTHNTCRPEHPAADATGFAIGWDHAQHGLVPPPELMLPGTPVAQGWRSGRAVFGTRTLPANRAIRQWLLLRLQAWREGAAFDVQGLSASALAQREATHCVIRRQPLGGASGHEDAAVFERLDPQQPYGPGNVVQISRAAVRAWAGVDAEEARRRARQCEVDSEALGETARVNGLDAAAWWRASALRSFTQPMALHDAARVPLAVLPPTGVHLANDAQGLQTLLTALFVGSGWSARARALGELLPEHTLRPDYNLLVGALAPRVLAAQAAGRDMHQALEDAWLNERVQRRWQFLALQLGDAGIRQLVTRAAARGLAKRRSVARPCRGASR